jgi:hypothetical protein
VVRKQIRGGTAAAPAEPITQPKRRTVPPRRRAPMRRVIKADGVDRLADDLENDTLMTTPETARWLNVSKQFLEIGYGPPATVLSPKVVRYRKNAVLRAKAEALS